VIIFLPRLIGAEDWDVVDERYQKTGNDIAFVYVPMLCSFAHAIWPNVPLKAMVGGTKLEIGSNCSTAREACNQLGLEEIAKGFDAAYLATCGAGTRPVYRESSPANSFLKTAWLAEV
jgi:hypothetical protein